MSEGQKSFLHFPTTSTSPIDLSTMVDVYLGDPAEMEYYLEEMRRRQLMIVVNSGEDVLWLPRRMSGTRCPFWKTEESQCEKPLDPRSTCYNTGWIGGYHDPTMIKIVFPPANRTGVSYEEGVRKEYTPRPWTIHTPIVSSRDIIVQKVSGIRFEIVNVSPVLFRGLVMHQEMELTRIERDHFAFNVPLPSPRP